MTFFFINNLSNFNSVLPKALFSFPSLTPPSSYWTKERKRSQTHS